VEDYRSLNGDKRLPFSFRVDVGGVGFYPAVLVMLLWRISLTIMVRPHQI
jgi:hypothetical protein